MAKLTPTHAIRNPARRNPEPELQYIAMDVDGHIVSVSDTREQAMDSLIGLPGPRDVMVDDIADEPIDWQGIEQRRNPDAGEVANDPRRALQRAGLEPLDIRDVMKISLDAAHSALVPYFDMLHSTSTGKAIRAYRDPSGMAEAFLGQNYKTAKGTPEKPSIVMGLTLLPARRLSHFEELEQPNKKKRPIPFGKRGDVLIAVDRLLRASEEARGRARSIVPAHTSLTPRKRVQQWSLCAGSNADCENSCLVYSGRNVADVYNHRRKAVGTLALLERPDAFCRMLIEAIRIHAKSDLCKEMEPFVRLNVLSDVPWELLIPGMFSHFEGGPIRFYDYTKVGGRKPPPNYDLTFSYSGTNETLARAELARGFRVAAVFMALKAASRRSWKTFRYVGPSPGKGKQRPQAVLPETFWGLPVIDGDVSDIRPRDPRACIVGLRWKTPAGRNVEPTEEKFKFVTRAYHIGGEIYEQSEGEAESMRESAEMSQMEYLMAPVTPRYQPIDSDSD